MADALSLSSAHQQLGLQALRNIVVPTQLPISAVSAPRDGRALRAEVFAREALQHILGNEIRVASIAEPVEYTTNLVQAANAGSIGVGAEMTLDGHVKLLIAVEVKRERFSILDRSEVSDGVILALQKNGFMFCSADPQTETAVSFSWWFRRPSIRKLHLYFTASQVPATSNGASENGAL